MDLALKKIDLINWITKQDEEMIEKIEGLRKSSIDSNYDRRMKGHIETKLSRSQADIDAGRVYAQEDVETYFKNKPDK